MEKQHIDTLDLMRDEFKRIRALHSIDTPHDQEVNGLCDRAIMQINQRVSVITQRDQLAESLREAKIALEDCVEWLEKCNYKATTHAGQVTINGREILRSLNCTTRASISPINIILDGPPGPESGRFIEVEDDAGNSLSVGTWRQRKDGRWALRIESLPEVPTASI